MINTPFTVKAVFILLMGIGICETPRATIVTKKKGLCPGLKDDETRKRTGFFDGKKSQKKSQKFRFLISF